MTLNPRRFSQNEELLGVFLADNLWGKIRNGRKGSEYRAPSDHFSQYSHVVTLAFHVTACAIDFAAAFKSGAAV